MDHVGWTYPYRCGVAQHQVIGSRRWFELAESVETGGLSSSALGSLGCLSDAAELEKYRSIKPLSKDGPFTIVVGNAEHDLCRLV